jgi:hypothetical protein
MALDDALVRLLSPTASWQLRLSLLIELVTREHIRCHTGTQPNEQTSLWGLSADTAVREPRQVRGVLRHLGVDATGRVGT